MLLSNIINKNYHQRHMASIGHSEMISEPVLVIFKRRSSYFLLKNLILLYQQHLSSIMSAIPSFTLQGPCSPDLRPSQSADLIDILQTEELHQSAFWNEQFPTYNFEKEIAVTDNSLVWIGTTKDRCERVALKITHNFQTESSEKNHQNKQNEFVAKHHLNCMVQVKEILVCREFRLMVMKYYRWDLEQIQATFTSNKNKRYTQPHFVFVIYVFKNLLDAVSQLHSTGYVHRDLKPDNILIDQEFKLVLGDFGLVTKQMEIDAASAGTLQFLAPERLSKRRRQNPIKKAVDVWSLGIILYELFTGENPFNGDSQQQIFESICEGYIKNKQIPEQAMNLICRMLEVNSDKRPTIEQIKNHHFLQRNVDKSLLKGIISTDI